MARNRKHQTAAIRFVPALKAVLLCLVVGGAAVGYVWQKNEIHDQGRQIREREIKLEKLREANGKLHRQLMTLRSPQMLERRIKELNLGLVQPAPSQLWRIVETPVETTPPSLPSPSPSLYAARPAGKEFLNK